MAGDQLDLLGGHLIGDRYRLFRIAGVVADFQRQLLTEDAAGLVDIGDRLFGAQLHLLAEGRVFAGHRTDGGDFDLCHGWRGGQGHDGRGGH